MINYFKIGFVAILFINKNNKNLIKFYKTISYKFLNI